MELQQVDALGTETAETALDGQANGRGRKVLGVLALTGPPLVVVPVIPNLRGEDALVSLLAESVAEQRLTVAIAVDVGGVEEGHSEVVCNAEEAYCVVVPLLAPPAGRESPEAKADFRNQEACCAEYPVLQGAASAAHSPLSISDSSRERRKASSSERR
jgi:hypothetical protein